jgi:Glycosyltransferase
MRLLLICDLPPNSGIGRYATSLFSKIRENGMYVDLMWFYEETFSRFLFPLRKYPLAPIFHEMINAIHKFSSTIKFNQNNYDIYHLTNPSLSILADKLQPMVITVHDMIPFLPEIRNSPTDFLLRRGIKNAVNANFIICTSIHTKNDLLRFVNIDPKKIRVVYYGVDHELFKPKDKLEARRRLGLPLDRPIILNVGSEEPRKNIPILVKAFGILVKDVPNAMLIRVGSPTNTIKKLIHSQGLEGKIVYLRPTDEDLSFLYNASDVFVFPSYYEGLGLPLLEAMASSCPVIAGNRSAIPEAVGDGGILLDPFDVDGFAYWMHEVLSNEDLRIKLSEKGYRRSLNFSWEKCARETLEVYREVLNEV